MSPMPQRRRFRMSKRGRPPWHLWSVNDYICSMSDETDLFELFQGLTPNQCDWESILLASLDRSKHNQRFNIHPGRIHRPCLSTFCSYSLSSALSFNSRLHDRALIASGRFIRVLRLLDLANDQFKGLGDILVVACAGLRPCTLIFLAQLLSHFLRDLPLFWAEITLVANNHDWYPFRSLCTVSG